MVSRNEPTRLTVTASAISCTPLICTELYFLSGNACRDAMTKKTVLACINKTVTTGGTPVAEMTNPANWTASIAAMIRSFV